MMGRWLVWTPVGKDPQDGEAKLGGTVTRRAGLERSQVRAEGPVRAELLPKAGGEGYQESNWDRRGMRWKPEDSLQHNQVDTEEWWP